MAASVLIIDAEEDFANQLADSLRDEGIEPAVTGDGKVGLDLARINVPAAIVLCVELPRMSGYSICAKLKKDNALKGVPLIITSAEATPETFEHHKKLKTRAEEYLKKPFSPALLVDVLRQYVQFTDARGRDEPISEELSIEDAPPATLSDDEAFGEEESTGKSRAESEEMSAIDGLLSDLTRPPPLPGARTALNQVASVPSAASSRSFEEDDEVMTNVGLLPTPLSQAEGFQQEIDELKEQLQQAREALSRSEREKALAIASERAATMAASSPSQSQVPSASSGREVVALKKELNVKERELLELKDKLHQKDKELLTQRDRETELEGQIVQLDEERTQADAARSQAEDRALRAEEASQAADHRAASAETKAQTAERAQQQAEKQAQASEAKARDAERKAAQAESRASAADGKAAQAEARANAADTKAAQAEARFAELTRSSETQISELNKRLGQAAAHEAELDGALQSVTQEAASLRDTIADQEAAFATAQEHIQTLRGANQSQNQEITKLTNELSAANAESESLRQQLESTQMTVEDLQQRIAGLDTELATSRGETDGLRTTLQELEHEREVNEGRIARAYQRIRDDEKIKGKARKAIEIALALLQEAGYSPDAEGTPPPDSAESVDEARS